MSLTIEQLRAQVAEKTQAAMAKAKEQAEYRVLTARLGLVESDAFQNALSREAEQTAKYKTLTDHIAAAKEVIVSAPVHDPRTRQDKEWNGRPTYGLGKDVQLLHELCSGMLYSVDQHKTVMQELTGLNMDTVEQFLTALGNTAYYSGPYNVVIDEVPYNLEAIKSTAMLLGEQLGLVIDTSAITEQSMNKRFTSARLQAEKQKLANDSLPEDTHFTMG